MSALTDLFSSMANKIRSKTGTATTYTPPQMVSDGIDDVFDAGVASATSPITPSDSSPVSMSANTGYKPTTAGYAIKNNPTSITPSISSPVTISSGTIYKASGNGKAIESYTEIAPYTTPQTVTKNSIVKIKTANGSICTNMSDATPSDTSPVQTLSGLNFHMLDSGYLVKTVSKIGEQPDKVYTSDSNGTSGTTTISVTQKPRYAFVSAVTTNSSNYFYMILVDFTKNKAWRFARNGSSTITNSDYSSSISTMFPTVSSSSVVFQNNSINSTKRLFIALYY